MDKADDTVGAEGLMASREAFAMAGSGGVSPEGCDLFFPDESGDGGEGRLGMVKNEWRGSQTSAHLLVEFYGDSGRKQRLSPLDRISIHDRMAADSALSAPRRSDSALAIPNEGKAGGPHVDVSVVGEPKCSPRRERMRR